MEECMVCQSILAGTAKLKSAFTMSLRPSCLILPSRAFRTLDC